jgi:hypothetical protein
MLQRKILPLLILFFPIVLSQEYEYYYDTVFVPNPAPIPKESTRKSENVVPTPISLPPAAVALPPVRILASNTITSVSSPSTPTEPAESPTPPRNGTSKAESQPQQQASNLYGIIFGCLGASMLVSFSVFMGFKKYRKLSKEKVQDRKSFLAYYENSGTATSSKPSQASFSFYDNYDYEQEDLRKSKEVYYYN